MTDLRLQERLPTQHQVDPVAPRRITVGLEGGEAQPETTRVALDIGRTTGAQRAGFTAFDPEMTRLRQEPLPIGGACWARRLAAQRRERTRERAAGALAEFDQLSAEAGIPAAKRREAAPTERLDQAPDTGQVIDRMRRFDAAVMARLSDRTGWFAAARRNVHELVADTVPLTLLP